MFIDVAKISSQGQITAPVEIKKDLGLQNGDKVAFMKNAAGEYVLVNASRLTLSRAQKDFEGAAEQLGLKNEEDLLALIKQTR